MRVGLALCGDVRTLGDARFTAVNRIRKEGACHSASGGVEDPGCPAGRGMGGRASGRVESSTRDARSVDRGMTGRGGGGRSHYRSRRSSFMFTVLGT